MNQHKKLFIYISYFHKIKNKSNSNGQLILLRFWLKKKTNCVLKILVFYISKVLISISYKWIHICFIHDDEELFEELI
jgi:hypothetical protein